MFISPNYYSDDSCSRLSDIEYWLVFFCVVLHWIHIGFFAYHVPEKMLLIGISSKVKCISVTITPHKVRIDIIISLLSIILKTKTTKVLLQWLNLIKTVTKRMFSQNIKNHDKKFIMTYCKRWLPFCCLWIKNKGKIYFHKDKIV